MWFSKSHLRILRVLRCFDPLEVSGHAYPSMDHNHHTDDHRKISHLLEHRVTLSPKPSNMGPTTKQRSGTKQRGVVSDLMNIDEYCMYVRPCWGLCEQIVNR